MSIDRNGTRPGPVAGIDVGGTKIAVLIVDADGAVLGRATHVSSVGDQDGAVPAIAAALDAALQTARLSRDDLIAVGVGVPGRVDPERGHVTLAVNLGWTDLALQHGLEAVIGRPVVIENDVRAAAIGLHGRAGGMGRRLGTDARLGRDRDPATEHEPALDRNDDLAYLAIGTGIAAGVILDGRLHRGARGLAGEIGHAIVDPNGPRCACGQRGCLEALVSGPSIARRANAASPREVYAAAVAGDPDAVDLVEDVGRLLAWAIHTLVMTYDIERVVVGGGVSHAGEPFERPLRRELDRLRAASEQAGQLLPADIVDVLPPDAEAGAWGAVAVARNAIQGSEVVSHA